MDGELILLGENDGRQTEGNRRTAARSFLMKKEPLKRAINEWSHSKVWQRIGDQSNKNHIRKICSFY